MLTILRWIAFLPAAFVASILVGTGFYWVGTFFGEFYSYVMCGAGGAGAFIAVGLFVSPKRNNAVKWTLIVLSVLIGVLGAVAVALGDDDKLKMAEGISMAIFSLVFAYMPADEVAKLVRIGPD